jgi:HK97 gp10 family phage protein
VADEFTIDGLADLAKNMEALPPKIAARAARPALNAAGKVFEAAIDQTVPVRSGALKAAMADKVKVSGNLETMSVLVGARYVGGYKHTSADPGVRIKFLEFGTRKMKATFFMRRAFDIGKEAAVKAATTVLKAVVDELGK